MKNDRIVNITGAQLPQGRSSIGGIFVKFFVASAVAMGLLAALSGCGPSPKALPPAHHPTHHQKSTTPPPAPSTPPSTPPATPPGPPDITVQVPPIPFTNTVVNGCNPTKVNPAMPGGFCLSGPLPNFSCCSNAYVEWSNIFAGESVSLNGSVPVDPATGQPQSSAVYVESPSGKTVQLPTKPDGRVGGTVAFDEMGTYQIGVIYKGQMANSDNFFVPYEPHVISGRTLQSLFPDSNRHWPELTVLAAPVGQTATFEVQFTDANGTPIANRTFNSPAITTDPNGMATVTLPPNPNGLWMYLYASPLDIQTYLTLPVKNGQLQGIAPLPKGDAGPSTVASLTQGGTVYYNATDLLERLDADEYQFPPGSGNGSSIVYDPTTPILTVTTPDSYWAPPATLNTQTGAVDLQVPVQTGSTYTISIESAGHVTPIVSGGQVYLDLPDFVTLANAVAWAAIAPDGSLLFSDFTPP